MLAIETAFSALFCCAAAVLLLLAEGGNGLPSPESRAPVSAQELGQVDGPSLGRDGSTGRLKELLHGTTNVHAGHGGLGDGFPSSEDEFIEHLEKLLKTGGFRDRQHIYHNSQVPTSLLSPINTQQQQAPLPSSPSSNSPENIIQQAAQKIMERHQQRLIGSAAELPQGWAHHPVNKEPTPTVPQLKKMKPFAYKPSEKQYWAHEPSEVVSQVVAEQPEAPQQAHYLRELPISPENYDQLYPSLEPSPTVNHAEMEQNMDAIDPLQHLHRLASLSTSTRNGSPKNVHPDDFLDKPSREDPARGKMKDSKISTALGQKEIVTYIDIPKMITVEDIAGASVGPMKKEDDVNAPASSAVKGNLSGKGVKGGQQSSAGSNKKEEEKGAIKQQVASPAGIELDVGDSKTHWLQSAPGKKMSKEEQRGQGNEGVHHEESKDESEVIDNWKSGINDDDDDVSHGPRALKLSHPGGNGKAGKNDAMSKFYFIGAIAGCSAAVAFGVVAAGIFWHRLKKNAKAAEETEYPAYGITGPGKHGGSHDVSPTSGDRKLAHSAQMYHYQHQKQQMIAMENHGRVSRRHGSTSDAEESDEEENEEGDYTVYECPGLAPTGEMEVRNPLFQDDLLTPSSPRPELADDDEDPVQP